MNSEETKRELGRMEEVPAKSIQSATSAQRFSQATTGCPKGPKVHTSFRINPVVELFSRMKGDKEILLKEIGLHGLTTLPREDPTTNRSFNCQFAFWLLSKLDSESGAIELGMRGRLEMRSEDVHLVIGIQCSGEELKKSDPLRIQKTKKLVKEALMLGTEDDLTLENVMKVLDREIPEAENGAHRRAFVMAAYIFAVSYFLAPKGRPAKVNYDILECILDTNNITNINWASYVLMSLKEASAKLRKELLAKTKSVTLDGCLLLLQVVYLDNIDFGLSSTRHNVIPRIQAFQFEKLNELINADKKKDRGAAVTSFGLRELRTDQDTIYTRGDLYRAILNSRQKHTVGVCLQSDKDKIMEYVRKNVEEGKRIVKMASRQFEEHATNTLDQCHLNISALLDVWLPATVIGVGKTRPSHNCEGEVSGKEGEEMHVNSGYTRPNGGRGRYKTMTRRPSKVRKMLATNNASDEND